MIATLMYRTINSFKSLVMLMNKRIQQVLCKMIFLMKIGMSF